MPSPVVNQVQTHTTSFTVPATTAGNCAVVAFTSFGTTAPTITSVDLGTSGSPSANPMTQRQAEIYDLSGTYVAAWIYELANIPAGQTLITITGTHLDLTAGDGGGEYYELSTVLTSGEIDGAGNNGHGNSATFSSGSTGTLSQNGDIVFGFATAAGGMSTSSPGSPWVNTIDTSGIFLAGYLQDATTAAETYGPGTCTSGQWVALVIALKTSSGVNVSLPVAQVNVAEYALNPSVNITLPVAALIIAGYPVSPKNPLIVALPVAQITQQSYPATPVIGKGVTLPVAGQFIVAYPMVPFYSTSVLLMSLVPIRCDDPLEGVPCSPGLTFFGTAAGLIFQPSLSASPASVFSGGDGIIELIAGSDAGGDPSAVMQLQTEPAGEGVMTFQNMTTFLMELNATGIGYPATSGTAASVLNALLVLLNDQGIINL
jgi:hypothetical protein